METKKYGARLKAARKHAKLSQADLAEMVGLSQPTISNLEKPENDASGSEYTVKLARACGVSVDWLDDEIGEMLPSGYDASPIDTSLQAREPTSKTLSVVESDLPSQVIAFARRIAALPPNLWPGIDNAISNLEAITAADHGKGNGD